MLRPRLSLSVRLARGETHPFRELRIGGGPTATLSSPPPPPSPPAPAARPSPAPARPRAAAGVEWVEAMLESVAPPVLAVVDGDAYGVYEIRPEEHAGRGLVEPLRGEGVGRGVR